MYDPVPMQRLTSIPRHRHGLGWPLHRRCLAALSFFSILLGLALAVGAEPEPAKEDVPGDASGLPAVGLEPDPLFDEFDLEFEAGPVGFPDPVEPVNRGMLKFNEGIDRFVMDPITTVYRFILPEMVRRSIERCFDNIDSTQTLVNDIFQLEWKEAGITTTRLVINTTIGVGGLFDPAKAWGIEGHISDFGQTLAMAGAPSGPYVILPLLGPSNVRDGIGLGVDALFNPTFFLLGGTDVLFFSGSSGLTERARHVDELNALKESSIDYYAALRSAYYQNRQAEIWEGREHRRKDLPIADATARSW
ncbi:MAG: VacJ family lipoprotein [Myxococcota bacterium]|nr:VacJ family lipoprotein [Myxococcota bacterium]